MFYIFNFYACHHCWESHSGWTYLLLDLTPEPGTAGSETGCGPDGAIRRGRAQIDPPRASRGGGQGSGITVRAVILILEQKGSTPLGVLPLSFWDGLDRQEIGFRIYTM